jgi:hypothetical protein
MLYSFKNRNTIHQTRKCTRCGLEYEFKGVGCPYCKGKTKEQIITDIHIPHAKQLNETSTIGRYFIYLVIVLACLLPILW